MGPPDVLEALGQSGLPLPRTDSEFLCGPSRGLGAIRIASSRLTFRLRLAVCNIGGKVLPCPICLFFGTF
jgi:hypothetical protein